MIMLENQIPCADLRQAYIGANLRQRYRVAMSRLENPEHGPNRVVTAVAALEGFARAVTVKGLVAEGASVDDAYARVRWTGPLELIADHVLPALGTTAEEAFNTSAWALIPEAIQFRNLLVHEATYLHGGTCEELIAAVTHVAERMAQLAGVKETGEPLASDCERP